MINTTFVITFPQWSGSRTLEDFGEKREMLFPWNPGTGFYLEMWKSRCRLQTKKTVFVLKWLLFSISCSFILLLVRLAYFFPPVLIFDASCQIHMDRHLHSLTVVDVGKDHNTCGHTCMFAYDLRPHGDYHTRTRTDKWTHIPGKVLQVWKHGPFSVCNLRAVGVNVTHTWCVMHSAYGRRGWRKLSSP